jgi:hypothetical protein
MLEIRLDGLKVTTNSEVTNAERLKDMEHENAEILRAIADGKKVQYRNSTSVKDWIQHGPWQDFDARYVEACSDLLASGRLQWRIAPKTVKIGEHEVPEPCRAPLEPGRKFWVVTPFGGAAHFTWDGTKPCYDALEGGFVHLTEKAARQHYEAIKSMLGGQVN